MSETSKNPSPPRHLSASSRTLWRTVVEDYHLEQHALHLLRLACESLDLSEQARRQLMKEGLTVPTVAGIKTHPAVAVQRNAKQTYISLIRALGINEDKTKRPVGRPREYLP